MSSSVLHNWFSSYLFLFFILLLVLRISDGQHVSIGRCPQATGIKDFNTEAYHGQWYEVEKYFFLFEVTTTCPRVVYHQSPPNRTDGSFPVDIYQFDTITGKEFHNPGNTRFRSTDGSGDFILDLIVTQSPVPFPFKYPYLVLGTDYTSFTIKWHCQQAGPVQIQNLWILSRTKEFTAESKEKAYSVLRSFGISTHPLKKSDLSTCKS